MTTPTPNATKEVYDAILTFDDAREFTTVDVCDLVGQSQGAVSGALWRFRRCGMVAQVDKRGNAFIYKIVDRDANINFGSRGPGGAVGRTTSKRGSNSATQRSLVQRALDLAADLEAFAPDLSTVPSYVLLNELTRRAKEDAKAFIGRATHVTPDQK